MRLFGLIGYPLTHSFSQKFFTEKFEKLGIKDCQYENFSITNIENIKSIFSSNPGLEGLNVTIPYKESVISFLDEMTDVVRNVMACNCIRIENGRLKGFNTDTIGFEKSLLANLKVNGKNALILGTGGAAKAVEFVLKKLGFGFKYVSRKPSINNFSYEQITGEVIAKYHLIINTTPLGMYPNTIQAPPIPYEALTPNHFLYDLIYNPEKSLFLEKGQQRGAAILNGYEMLLAQAEESWNIWNSK